ncbi:MAG TPA: hypothetical protein VLX11_09490 [Candidatus Acidoferrales bacterium]|nr:hypothetical protein [Candidatus Acidoferrales bacterium]
MQLWDALVFHRGDMAAFIGAVGKTTTLLKLAKELRDEGEKEDPVEAVIVLS